MTGIVVLWVVGGLFSLAGALTLAELEIRLPSPNATGAPITLFRPPYGARDPAVDALIDKVVSAQTRPQLVGAVRALFIKGDADGAARRHHHPRIRRHVPVGVQLVNLAKAELVDRQEARGVLAQLAVDVADLPA